MILGIVGCSIPTYRYDYETYKNQVFSVQLIYYDNPDIGIQEYEFKSFHADKCEVIEELNPEKIDEFLMDFSEREVAKQKAKTDSPIGYGIRIVYKDGSFFVYTWGSFNEAYNRFLAEYNGDGSVKQKGIWVDHYFYMTVAANYFETKIQL